MRALRYTLLFALLVPGAALAQVVGETNAILTIAGNEYAVAATQNYGVQFENGATFGPNLLVQSVGPAGDGTTIDGCQPFDNAADIAGNIALISRGACAFVTKAENAAAAGAVAYIVYMDEREGQEGETLVNMGGDCDESVCSVPGVFLSRRDYKSILPDVKFEEEATITIEFSDLPSVGEVATGVVNLPIYDNGFFGAVPENNYAPVASELPFTFNGFTPLRIGSVLVSTDGTVAGSPYAEASEYVRTSTVLTGTLNEGRDPATQASFRSEELGVKVVNLTFGTPVDAGPPACTHIIMQLSVSSTTGADINDAYFGIFADWDVVDDGDDASTNDSGGWSGLYNLAYVFDADMAQYYGVMAVVEENAFPGSVLGGYTTDSGGTDEDLFTALSSNVTPADGELERAVVVGQGPFTLPASGDPVTQVFALVAGTSEASLLDNAQGVYSRYFPCLTNAAGCPLESGRIAPSTALQPDGLLSATAQGPSECGRTSDTQDLPTLGTYRLASVYPNPVSTTAQVDFSLPTAEEARVEVYDLLGRRVAVVAEGVRPAGTHTVTLDATGLPSGVYVVRLSTPSVALTERVTVVR
ncbi:MAG: PA domain-containing protein [Bacteroidota bacterium]